MPEALFIPDGGRFIPTVHTRGPWDSRAQHAGPPAALMGRAIEMLPADLPMRVARFTMEVLRPVPLEPLSVEARVERHGRRVQLASAVLTAGGTELCRAYAWRIRTAVLDVALDNAPEQVAAPESGEQHLPESDEPAFHRTGVEMRFVRGSFWRPGPATAWIRLRYPLIPGEEPSPLTRVLGAADFGNGVSALLEFGQYLFINTDLSAYLYRQPDGEWICLDATTRLGPDGIGLAESALYDVRGRIGRSLQALLVDRL